MTPADTKNSGAAPSSAMYGPSVMFTPTPRVTPQLAKALTPPFTSSGRPSRPRLTPVVVVDHVAERERRADVTQVEERVGSDACFVRAGVVAQRCHGDVAGVESENRREPVSDRILEGTRLGRDRPARSAKSSM